MELKALIDTASEQSALMEQLLESLERETSELSEVKIDAMNQTNLEKEDLIRKISKHAPVLQNEIAAVAALEGLPSDVTLGVLAKYLAKQGRNELSEIHGMLKKTSASIKRVATMNRTIAERFASTISTSLDLITRLINQSNTYGATGGLQRRATGSVMINREA